jgi:hypothetical protein
MKAETILRKENKRKGSGKAYSRAGKQTGQKNYRPAFQSSRELLYALRRMYGLPLQITTRFLPWGYDSIVELEQFDPETQQEVTRKYALPNDQAFKLLVQGKYLIDASSYRKVGAWLGESFIQMGYDFSHVRGYNPEQGLSVASINRLYTLYCPEDVCVLPLNERQQAYELRFQSTGCNLESLERARPFSFDSTGECRD